MAVDLSAYSFCEPTHAGPLVPWCIRKLSAVGRKVGGGVDTPSLCGRVKPCGGGGFGGWDVATRVEAISLETKSAHGTLIVCKACADKMRSAP